MLASTGFSLCEGEHPSCLPSRCWQPLVVRVRSVWIHVGTLGSDFLRKFCSQQSLESVLSLAFFTCFKSYLKRKNTLSAERSLGSGDQEAVVTYSLISVSQAADYSFECIWHRGNVPFLNIVAGYLRNS